MKEESLGNSRTLPHWTADTPVTADNLNKMVDAIQTALDEVNVRLSTAGGTIQGELNVTGSLKRAGNAVYDTGNKPTPAEIGAMSASVSQITTPGSFAVDPRTTTGGWECGLDLKNRDVTYARFGGFGSGVSDEFFYLFMGKDYGDNHALRWHSNGKVSVGTDVLRAENGDVLEHGTRVYSPNNKPSAADVGAVAGKLIRKGSHTLNLTTGNYLIFGHCELIGRERHTGYLSYIKVVYSNQLFVDGSHGSVSGNMGGTDFSETIMQQPSVRGVNDEICVYRMD